MNSKCTKICSYSTLSYLPNMSFVSKYTRLHTKHHVLYLKFTSFCETCKHTEIERTRTNTWMYQSQEIWRLKIFTDSLSSNNRFVCLFVCLLFCLFVCLLSGQLSILPMFTHATLLLCKRLTTFIHESTLRDNWARYNRYQIK